MTKWEYEIIRPYGRLTDAEEDQMFARQGAAGYEFCGSAPHGGYIFTRPVEEPIASVESVPIYPVHSDEVSQANMIELLPKEIAAYVKPKKR